MGKLWRLPLESYEGLLMRCAPGTHAAAMALLRRHADPGALPAPAALDLAAGTGAFVARLRDAGAASLHAVELDRAGFGVEGVEPMAVDLNSAFAPAIASQSPAPFGLVSAIEIIEHLDCPRQFLRQIHALLAPGGYLLLTTPNVANWTGRLRFFMSGQLRQFRAHDYAYQRHISPITDVQMGLMLREVGFELVEAVTAGTFFGPLKRAVLWPVRTLVRLVWGDWAVDDVRIYLARRVEPDASSTGRDSFYFQRTEAGEA